MQLAMVVRAEVVLEKEPKQLLAGQRHKEELQEVRLTEELQAVQHHKEELQAVQHHKEELQAVQRRKEELQEVQRHKEELQAVQSRKEELQEVQRHKEELQEVRLTEELLAAQRRKEELQAAQHHKEELQAAQHRKEELQAAQHRKEELQAAQHHKEELQAAQHHKEELQAAQHHKEELQAAQQEELQAVQHQLPVWLPEVLLQANHLREVVRVVCNLLSRQLAQLQEEEEEEVVIAVAVACLHQGHPDRLDLQDLKAILDSQGIPEVQDKTLHHLLSRPPSTRHAKNASSRRMVKPGRRDRLVPLATLVDPGKQFKVQHQGHRDRPGHQGLTANPEHPEMLENKASLENLKTPVKSKDLRAHLDRLVSPEATETPGHQAPIASPGLRAPRATKDRLESLGSPGTPASRASQATRASQARAITVHRPGQPRAINTEEPKLFEFSKSQQIILYKCIKACF
ncbi:hypothetical protein GPALN_005803 [Globodera pallida]|nr:hypothetical protein GPALN_005803 [Globodera pallida]